MNVPRYVIINCTYRFVKPKVTSDAQRPTRLGTPVPIWRIRMVQVSSKRSDSTHSTRSTKIVIPFVSMSSVINDPVSAFQCSGESM